MIRYPQARWSWPLRIFMFTLCLIGFVLYAYSMSQL